MFYQDGTPNHVFYESIRDRNCDGKLTDIDGDGFTHPADPTLGPELALDCDELDPRVGPGEPSADQENMLVCSPDSGLLLNDSICKVLIQPYQPGENCPVLSLSGTSITTVCEEIKNQDGSSTGEGVCAFPGWSDANPLSISATDMFGPCDGDAGDPNVKLPCSDGMTCGGPEEGSPWTSAFETYIRNRYYEGGEIRFKGMCFPACKLPKP